MTVAQAYAAAVSFHRQGRLEEAAQIYRAVLQIDRNHVDSLHYLGLICTQRGRPREAEALLRQALAPKPKAPQVCNDLGIALAALGRFEEAVGQYREAIGANPYFVEAYNNIGTALQALNRPAQAIGEFEKALSLDLNAAAVLNNLGIALASLNRHEEAAVRYRQTLVARPDLAEAHHNLGLSLAALGHAEEALAHYEKAVSLKPAYFEGHKTLASALASLNRPEAAIEHFRKALSLRPNSAEIHYDFGNALAALGRREEAITYYRRALAIRPDFAEAHNNLANVLTALGKHTDAAAHYRQALVIRPDYAEAQGNLANALVELGRLDEAVACYEKALAIAPSLPDAQYNLGNILQTLGQLTASRQAFEKAVALAPKRAEYYRGLAESKKFLPGDPHLATMEQLAANMNSLTESQRVELHFALGKAYADLDRHEQAWHHIQEGNVLQRKRVNYDESATLRRLQSIAEVFTSELMSRNRGLGDPTSDCVFIIGMPRSGTTLVEQILASHPKAFGAGELMNYARATEDLSPFPEAASSLTGEQLREIGARYVASVRALAPTAGCITDKMPSNFRYAGLIHMTLPNARIIHVRRDPVDTCLSCFSKIFTGEQPFAYDLAELGRFYRAYDALMAHWSRILPQGVMLEVQYEDLVADFEPQARRIVAHCRLEWDDACFAFHETERPVHTASATQVRQPIYGDAVGRSRPYAAMLALLLEALGNEGTRTI